MTQYEKIIEILKDLEISYDEIEHDETTSCEHSKTLREEAWLTWIWSKNIIFHAKWEYYLVTTLWTKEIKARRFKHEFKTKDIRFATQEEIDNLKLWTIWCIAPFWFDNETITIYIDDEIFEHEYFMFNPATTTKSIRIKTTDLQTIYSKMMNPLRFFSLTEDNFEIIE